MNIETANRLVQLRKEHNLSQEALAEKLGVSRQAVSKWERAEASPDTDNLIMLAKLYHISLDELLQIDSAGYENGDTVSGAETGEAAEEERVVWEGEVETEGNSDSAQKTNTGNEEYVHVGLDGVHVKDKDGEVHVGWSGIHVDDKKGGDNVHIDKNGVYVNGEKQEKQWFTDHNHFPMFLVIVIVYLLIGCLANAWHPGWLLFLLIPIWESSLEAIRKKSAKYFAYPVLATLLFFCTGIFGGRWHPGWVWFVTIPLYYSLVHYLEGNGGKNEER